MSLLLLFAGAGTGGAVVLHAAACERTLASLTPTRTMISTTPERTIRSTTPTRTLECHED